MVLLPDNQENPGTNNGQTTEPSQPVTKYANIRVSVTTGENTPVEGAVVTITNVADATITQTCTTGSAGGCRLDGIAEGVYSVTATAEGYVTYSDDDLNVTYDTTALEISLTPSG